MTRPADRPLMVFADDWGRHPSSCQHLIRYLLPHRSVVWVNTIGTRPPRLDWVTAKRAAGKLREWLGFPGRDRHTATSTVESSRGEQPRIVAPKMWPSFRTAWGRRLNRTLLLRALRPVVASLPHPPIVVTTLPLVADIVGRLPVHRWVYYCVDDFSVWPGYDGATMQRMERELVPRMDQLIAVSETLQRHLAELGRSAHLLTHGVDLDHWRQPTPPGPLAELAGLEPPYLVFWGVIDRRMDLAFVRHLAASLTRGTLVLVGPQDDPDPALFSLPRVRILPAMPFERLPALAAAAAVLVMPYADLPVTRAMQPLKLKEYLATGKPAVVRDLPATRPWADCADVAATPADFAALVLQRLESGLPTEHRLARQRLEKEGWQEKAMQFEKWLCEEKSAHAEKTHAKND